MATKKTYRTYFLKGLEILAKDAEGKRIVIKFSTGIQVDSTARYTTRDPYIHGILDDPAYGFGRDFYLESEREIPEDGAPVVEAPAVEEKPKDEKPVMNEVKGSERFLNLVEMKNRMAELGIELPEDANYQKAKAVAVEAGYDFQIQKKK